MSYEEQGLPPIEESAIRFYGDENCCPEAQILKKSFFKALAMDTKIPKPLVKMPGLSGKKFRYFINSVVDLTPDARYLEIGSFTGSTFCSAMYGNKAKGIAVDNFSERGGPKDQFLANMETLKQTSPDVDVSLLEQDYYKINFNELGKFNIYFFDGPHEDKDHYAALDLAHPALDDTFIYMVDDWNGPTIVNATYRAIEDLKMKVLFAIEIKTCHEWTFPHITCERSEWHNGYFIGVCQKPPK